MTISQAGDLRRLHAGLDRVLVVARDSTIAPDADTLDYALDTLRLFFALDFESAHRSALAAGVRASDESSRLLAAAALTLAAAGATSLRSWDDGGTDALLAALDTIHEPRNKVEAFATYLLAEGALACGRLDAAAAVLRRAGAPVALEHPFDAVIAVMRARVLAFQGRIDEGRRALGGIDRLALSPLLALLVDCTDGLLLGNAADLAGVRRLAARVEALAPELGDYLSNGCRLLLAFGLVAIGDVDRAAGLILAAPLEDLTVVDRGLVLELLVAAAAGSGDLDAAEAWLALALPLSGNPICGSTIARCESRVLLLSGDPVAAGAAADRAVALATAEGRGVERAEGEILAARARLAASSGAAAASLLDSAVRAADEHGHHSVRRAASRVLRTAGRRLNPEAGAAWSGLTAREREVAVLAAAGRSNPGIAADLHLSTHTVRAHMSRVLIAFAVPTRVALAALLGPEDAGAPGPLTPAQARVVDVLLTGATNAQIASRLGLSVKTVEKHLADVMDEWGVRSRAGIVARATGHE